MIADGLDPLPNCASAVRMIFLADVGIPASMSTHAWLTESLTRYVFTIRCGIWTTPGATSSAAPFRAGPFEAAATRPFPMEAIPELLTEHSDSGCASKQNR